MAPPRLNLRGEVFGRLTVLRMAAPIPGSGQSRWACRCECGTLKIVRANLLRNGHTQSCGCLRLTRLRQKTYIHGLSETPEYGAWQQMKKACYNPSVKAFKAAGAKGIVVCDRWKDSFENFLADVGTRPTPAHFLRRMDKTKPYEPGNLAWCVRKPPAERQPVKIRVHKPAPVPKPVFYVMVVPQPQPRPVYLQQPNTWFPSPSA